MKLSVNTGRKFREDTTLQEWVDEGVSIYRESEKLTWDLADWAAFGERTFGALKEFCEKHGMNYGTLRNFAYVATNVELSLRNDKLSFYHHMAVAPLPRRDQAKWLTKAAANNWSVAELRRQLRDGETDASNDGPIFRFEEKSALDLHHALTSKPATYWTHQTKSIWREKVRPIVEFYETKLL